MNFCKVMQAQDKDTQLTWLNARCGITVHVSFQSTKKRLAEGQELNALVANTVKEEPKSNKCEKYMSAHDSWSEEDLENFIFENSRIGEEWDNASGKRQNKAEVQDKTTVTIKGLNTIIHLVNPTKKKKNSHYTPVILGNMNGRLSKAKFHSIKILLDSRASSSLVIVKHTEKLRNKKTQPFKWST